jgi:L-lysine 2,3-aminomutase
VWQYHLEQMAVWDEPLRYIRRFILTDEEELEAAGEQPADASAETPASVQSVETKEPVTLPRRTADWC